MTNEARSDDEIINTLRDKAEHLGVSLDIADREVHRLMDVITEQAAEIRGLQEEATNYRNEIAGLQEEVKNLRAFMCMGEGI